MPPSSTNPPPDEPPPPGDLPLTEFRQAMHRVADIAAEYLQQVQEYRVVPAIAPGDVRRRLPPGPPEQPAPLAAILDDYRTLIEPNVTHWNHPGFLAYFAITGSAPGIVAEALAATLNVNAMLWRTGPAPTELEELVCDWLRQMIGLPPTFRGHINDTASIASLLGLAAARQRACPEARHSGLAGRSDLPPLVVYCSEHAHSSIDKAAITLGIGLDNLRKIPADAQFRMDVAALQGAVCDDRAAGRRPIAVVATAGTTSTASVDPLRPIGALCHREGLWLHVDAAYAGSAAICPELRPLFDGLELADSIVVNPHKWLFVPVDCSVMLVRDVDTLKEAFAVVPEYLKTADSGGTNLMDYGVQLGRRFRALKMWMVFRAYGVRGLQERIRYHCALAREFAGWVQAEPGLEVVAPVLFSTVCFRAAPPGIPPVQQDRFNERLLERVNAAGPVFLSHTRLGGRFVLRLAIGNVRTLREHVQTAWELVRATRRELVGT